MALQHMAQGGGYLKATASKWWIICGRDGLSLIRSRPDLSATR
jgi:hypothetical protein